MCIFIIHCVPFVDVFVLTFGIKHIDERTMILFGIIIVTLGYLFTFFAQNLDHLFLTQGVPIGNTQRYFKNNELF